jgi:hypothetical protein
MDSVAKNAALSVASEKENPMPLPEGYLPREGDALIIHVEVKYDVDASDGNVHVFPIGARHRDFALPLKSVIGLYCRRWNVGDEVTFPGMAGVGKVLAVHEDQVWVLFPDEPPQTFPANELKPAKIENVEAEPPPAPLTGSNDPSPSEDKEEIQF